MVVIFTNKSSIYLIRKTVKLWFCVKNTRLRLNFRLVFQKFRFMLQKNLKGKPRILVRIILEKNTN